MEVFGDGLQLNKKFLNFQAFSKAALMRSGFAITALNVTNLRAL